MRGLDQFKKPIEILFTDIDDTLTTHGKLPPQSYDMLWDLQNHGIKVIPVTGRPAGWCEMIARLWPVHGVIGENGAFYFRYVDKKMLRVFQIDEKTRKDHQQKLQLIEQQVLKEIPGSALASDQFTRLFDLAIDFCEDVQPLDKNQISQIVDIFKKYGATAKVSSIHVNGWFGTYDKKSMCEKYLKEQFSDDLVGLKAKSAFIGDSPNDEPLFESFENSFAVANILRFKDQLEHLPSFVTISEGGDGFVEFGKQLLKNKS